MLNILDSASPIVSKEAHVICPLKHELEKNLNSPSQAILSASILLIGTRVPNWQSFWTVVGPLNFTGPWTSWVPSYTRHTWIGTFLWTYWIYQCLYKNSLELYTGNRTFLGFFVCLFFVDFLFHFISLCLYSATNRCLLSAF